MSADDSLLGQQLDEYRLEKLLGSGEKTAAFSLAANY